jgi:deoxyribodipyrimidine photolyase-related protein
VNPKTRDDTPLWLFADQLGPAVHGGEHAHREVLLVEATSALRKRRYHRQKLHLVLSALRHADQDLGDRATLINSDTYTDALEQYDRPVLVHEPTSHAAEQFVHRLRKRGLVTDVLPTPTFALPRKDFEHWAGDRTRFRMEDFYRDQRRRFGVLMDGSEPVGSRWNYDEDNRESPPKKQKTLGLPKPYQPVEDDVDDQVRADLDRMNLDTVGVDGPRLFAVTPAEAKRALDRFIEHRLAEFGRYEDAIMGEDWAMSHSLLSVPLNLGVLHPLDAVEAAEKAYHQQHAPLSAVEGFIRQILGWREYVRGLYWARMPEYARTNALAAKRDLPCFYWSGETAMNCLAQCIGDTRAQAYAHHIQRLMVTGNFALIAGIDPAQVEEWYLVVYADAYEWVELPNVHGMVLWADGGVMGSKPYAASGAYIDRMSDYCGACAYDVKAKAGPKACPFNYLYWNFLIENEPHLAGNPRMAMPYRTLARMSDRRRAEISADAGRFLAVLAAEPGDAPEGQLALGLGGGGGHHRSVQTESAT